MKNIFNAIKTALLFLVSIYAAFLSGIFFIYRLLPIDHRYFTGEYPYNKRRTKYDYASYSAFKEGKDA